MTLPLWILLTFMAIQLVTAIVRHGENVPDYRRRYNGIITTIDTSVTLGLLYWAGLFQ